MAVVHVKSNTIADITGTATVWNSAGVTTTVAATDIVRPSDWNSAHQYTQTISGNTAGTSTAAGTNLVFGGTNGITLSHSTAANAATMWISGHSNTVKWAVPPWAGASNALISNVTSTAITQRPLFFPFECNGYGTFDRIHWPMSRATSASNAFTVQHGIYSYSNATRIDLIGSTQNVYSNTATGSVSGIRMFEAAIGGGMSTLSPGQYVMAFLFSAAATASMNYSLMGAATNNRALQTVILPGSNSYQVETTNQPLPFWGMGTTTTNALPSSYPLSGVSGQIVGDMAVFFTLGTSN